MDTNGCAERAENQRIDSVYKLKKIQDSGNSVILCNFPIRVIREPSCGNSETEGKAAMGSGERARVASAFQIRGVPMI